MNGKEEEVDSRRSGKTISVDRMDLPAQLGQHRTG